MDVYAENIDKLELEATKLQLKNIQKELDDTKDNLKVTEKYLAIAQGKISMNKGDSNKTEVVVNKCSNCTHMEWMNKDLTNRLNQVKEDKWFDIDKIVKGKCLNYETEKSLLKAEIEHLQIEKQVYEADLKEIKDDCEKEITTHRMYANKLSTDVSYYAKLSEYYRLRLIETTNRMNRIIKYIELNDECPMREDFVIRSKIVEENEKIKADNKL